MRKCGLRRSDSLPAAAVEGEAFKKSEEPEQIGAAGLPLKVGEREQRFIGTGRGFWVEKDPPLTSADG